MTARVAIYFNNLVLGYNRRPVVHHIEGTIEAGSLLAVVGPNGAGKSTLLKGLSGALPPLSGSVSFVIDGKEHLHPPRSQFAYLPQSSDIDRSFPISVIDFISAGLWQHIGIFGGLKASHLLAIALALKAVGLYDIEKKPIGSLSGGQFQRVLFARLILQDAPVILLDEPFTAIDSHTTNDLLMLVQQWHREKRTVIAILHDLDMVRHFFPSTLLIAGKPIAWGRTEDVINNENLLKAHKYLDVYDFSKEKPLFKNPDCR